MRLRPERGLFGGSIESLGSINPCSDAIMIAANVEFFCFECPHRIDDLIRLSTISNEVTEANDGVEFLAANVTQDRSQRFGVRVQIADDQRSQDVLRARPRGN